MPSKNRKEMQDKARKSSLGPLVNPVTNHPNGAYDGRPKYDASICEKIPEMYRDGQADVEVAVGIGISLSTFYDWVGKYPEFKQAVKLGKGISEVWWHEWGRKGVRGEAKVNDRIWGMNMRNRFGWDKEDIEKHNRFVQEKFDEIKSIAEKILEKNERTY